MSLVLRKQQMLALMILAFLTAVAVSYLLLTAVAHIDIWHIASYVFMYYGS